MPVGCGALLKNGARDFLRSGCEDAGFLLKGAVFGVLRSEGAQVSVDFVDGKVYVD